MNPQREIFFQVLVQSYGGQKAETTHKSDTTGIKNIYYYITIDFGGPISHLKTACNNAESKPKKKRKKNQGHKMKKNETSFIKVSVLSEVFISRRILDAIVQLDTRSGNYQSIYIFKTNYVKLVSLTF